MFPANTRILIADDMPTIRDLVRNHLRALGYMNIFEAPDGEQALVFLMSKSMTNEKIQLVISDWNMPHMTGLEFLKQVRARKEFSDLPFVLLTSESEREQVTEAILSGVSQYVVKPFSGKIFEDKLKAVWAKHNPPQKE